MFDDQETHYPVPGETPWERLRYLATSTETIYPVPPYVCMKCRRVIVPRKWALILHDLAEFLGYFWLFGIWFWPSVGVADQHITASCLCRINGVIDHRCRVRAFGVLDDIHAGTLCPDLQLVNGSRTERICRTFLPSPFS